MDSAHSGADLPPSPSSTSPTPIQPLHDEALSEQHNKAPTPDVVPPPLGSDELGPLDGADHEDPTPVFNSSAPLDETQHAVSESPQVPDAVHDEPEEQVHEIQGQEDQAQEEDDVAAEDEDVDEQEADDVEMDDEDDQDEDDLEVDQHYDSSHESDSSEQSLHEHGATLSQPVRQEPPASHDTTTSESPQEGQPSTSAFPQDTITFLEALELDTGRRPQDLEMERPGLSSSRHRGPLPQPYIDQIPGPSLPFPSTPTLVRPTASRTSSDITLPRWQPDAEVTLCPICSTQFGIFVRKHHCRLVLSASVYLLHPLT